MDTLFAPIYDEHWGSTIDPTHRAMLGRLLAACPPDALLLDAACGTGKYWPLILGSGRRVAGIDQSQRMLDVAQRKHPDVPLRKLGLQELDDQACYDAAICVDALELVCPEDWPAALGNLRRALRPRGLLYLTVELEAPEVLDEALRAGRAQGLPIVAGEVLRDGGYHFYPPLAQVHAWLDQAGFALEHAAEGDGYYHVLAAARRHWPLIPR